MCHSRLLVTHALRVYYHYTMTVTNSGSEQIIAINAKDIELRSFFKRSAFVVG